MGRGYPAPLEHSGELESGSTIPNYPVNESPRMPPSLLGLGVGMEAGVGKGAREEAPSC